MKSFMERDCDTFRKYAIRDAEICTQYTLKMIRLYQERTGKCNLDEPAEHLRCYCSLSLRAS